MNGIRQGWLVAAREIRERLRSPVYYLSLAVMVLVVVGAILVPTLVDNGGGTKDVALAGSVPAQLSGAIETQGDATGTGIRIHRFDAVPPAEQAVRDGNVDVLVVDGQRLEWRRHADERLKAVITTAIQLTAVRDRAKAAGIDPDALLAMVAPVPIENVVLGQVTGRSADDETATYILSLVLFLAVSMYGAMVLNGVVEEKSSRVVEVLLARIPARNLLVGKIAGIGLLGLAQVAVTGLVALVAIALSDFADIPAAHGSVIAWGVVWFVLGYALIATMFGVLGSLASRSEDASSVSGPLMVVLAVAYFVAFAAIGSPDALWARLASWFPLTAPFAMPNRIAMGAASWWEPLLAVVLTVATSIGLVVLGGRVYTHAILHTGGTLKLRDAWYGGSTATANAAKTNAASTSPSSTPDDQQTATSTQKPTRGWIYALPAGVGAVVAAAIIALSHDVIMGTVAAVGSFTVVLKAVQAWKKSRN